MTNSVPVQFIPVDQLRIHPKNLRLYYPPADVEEMAASIAAVGGVLQALLVVPTGETTAPDGLPTYYVVDGNMRLAAARTLPHPPALKCETIASNQAEQLLVMAATSHFHYPKDRISQGRHYQRLLTEEGLTVAEISALTGLHQASIYSAISLLELTDARTQNLIGEGKLSADIDLHRALARIPDPGKRAEMIDRIISKGLPATVAKKSVAHLLRQYGQLSQVPAVNGKHAAPVAVPAPLPKRTNYPDKIDKRAAAKFTPEKVRELARLHLCDECRLEGLTAKCYTCPGPYEFINALVDVLPVEEATPDA